MVTTAVRATSLIAALLSAACATAVVPRQGQEPAATSFLVEPYLWVPSQTGEVPDDEGDDTDVDLVGFEDLDAALMLAFEALPANSDWGVLFDSVYVRFDNEATVLRVRTGVQMIEAAAAYGPEGWRGVELFAGLRYWRVFAELALGSLASGREEEEWVDPVVGVRGTYPLSEAWSLHGRADVGGFGVEADWAFQVRADVRYAFGPRWELELGYRYVHLDFDAFHYEVALAGPSFGVRWSP